MPNRRTFYAIQQVGFSPTGSTVMEEAHGVQQVGITTSFDPERIFELGQVNAYENVEAIPSVEITVEKALDGYPLLYHLATSGSPTATLVGRSVTPCIFWLSVFQDTQDSCSGAPISEMHCSGAVPGSLTYNFPVEGNFTESMTVLANHKLWRDSGFVFSGQFPSNDDAPIGTGGVNRREDLIWTPVTSTTGVNGQLTVDAKCTVLPREIDGVSSSGTNPYNDASEYYEVPVQNISVSVDLNRQELLELGLKRPYFRFANFPVDVTCDIEILEIKWDNVEAIETGIYGNGENTQNQTIIVRAREGTLIDLGDKNRLVSCNRTGGDAGGGNVTTTYSYINSNFMTVTHPADPTTALRVY